MRSLGFTLILALLAIGVGGVAAWQWIEGNFDSVLGAPSTPLGQRLYADFAPTDVKFIQVSQNGTSATFELGPDGWQATSPWQDRMDPRAAVDIINFTLGLRVEDIAKRDKVDPQKAGLRESGTNIRLEAPDHRTLARYKMGRQTPWLATVKDVDEPVPTVFIQPRDEGHKDYIYACTGDIGSRFRDNLKQLRDHHPFYFNPLALQKIRIRTEQGELTLARETPQSPWRITMPQELSTDREEVKSLIEGLYEMLAVKLSDRASVTVPATVSPATSRQIAITAFGSETETILEIQPQTPESTEVMATVSNRPGTLFTLPTTPGEGMVSLAELPLTVNELRDSTLTHLNVKTLRGIFVEPSSGSSVLISRNPPHPWMATIDGKTSEANEQQLFKLLKTVTEGKVSAFETDAATDFTPWGLQRPFLTLRFLGATDAEVLELSFGTDGKGGYFVNRAGTPTIMRVEKSLIDSIPRQAYEWRHSRLWSIDRLNLMAIERTIPGEPPLMLRYSFSKPDPWTASREDKDLTATLNPSRANFVLDSLEGLQATRWLPLDDASALDALVTPCLTLKVIEKATDNMGDVTGVIIRQVDIAPGSKTANPAFYYGRIQSDPNPFLMDRDTYGRLSTRVIETP